MEMTSAAMRRPTFSFNEFPSEKAWRKLPAPRFLRASKNLTFFRIEPKSDETLRTLASDRLSTIFHPLFRSFERIIIRIIN